MDGTPLPGVYGRERTRKEHESEEPHLFVQVITEVSETTVLLLNVSVLTPLDSLIKTPPLMGDTASV